MHRAITVQDSCLKDGFETRSKPTGKLALIVMAVFLGVGVLGILATGLFRLAEGAIFTSFSWIAGPSQMSMGEQFCRGCVTGAR